MIYESHVPESQKVNIEEISGRSPDRVLQVSARLRLIIRRIVRRPEICNGLVVPASTGTIHRAALNHTSKATYKHYIQPEVAEVALIIEAALPLGLSLAENNPVISADTDIPLFVRTCNIPHFDLTRSLSISGSLIRFIQLPDTRSEERRVGKECRSL